ncbi:MAG: protein-L-isoaspartate O-methyltransferase [Alphaproteobacteria bacterium]
MPFDFARARENMIENDVRTNDVTDRRLIAALRAVPREDFVSSESRELAYAGISVPVGLDRHIMEARAFSKLAQAARIAGSERVLDVGCATGYASAVFSRLAREVVALESEEGLAKVAETALGDLRNVKVARGDLRQGAPASAPFDVIFVNGGVEVIPDGLTQQLAEGGRLLCIALEGKVGRGRIYERDGGVTSWRNLFDARVPLLPGFAKPLSFAL